MTRKQCVVILATGMILSVAGCGGSDETKPARATAIATATSARTPVALDHAAFVQALDETCRGSIADLAREADAAGNDTARLAGIMHRILARVRPAMAARAKLTAPPEDASAFRRYNRAQARLVGIYARVESALKANDTDQVQYLLGLLPEVRKARTTAALDLGTTRCGS